MTHNFHPVPKSEFIHKSGLKMKIHRCDRCDSELAFLSSKSLLEIKIIIEGMKNFPCVSVERLKN